MKHQARRRFGQNFLTDATVIDRIVAAIDPQIGDRIVEIGPGQGALTAPLLASGARVHVLEIDRDLAGRLAADLGNPEHLSVQQADALECALPEIFPGQPYRLAGNLPYNISTPLLFHVLAQAPLPQDMHFMLQREVVERIVADPGSRTYGRLGIMIQNRCQTQALFDIGPESFRPRPRVHSTLLRLLPRSKPLSEARPERFDQVVRLAFSRRRKTLRNSLSPLLGEDQIRSAGVDPGLRAEQLDIAQFDALAGAIPNH